MSRRLFWDDPGVLTFSIHEKWSVPVPGHRRSTVGGRRRRAPLSTSRSCRGPGIGRGWPHPGEAGPRASGLVRAGPDRVATRGDSQWDPRVASERHDDGATDGAARLVDELAHQFGSMARDGRRQLRHISGGASDLVPDLARRPISRSRYRRREWRKQWTAEATRYGRVPLPRPSTTARSPMTTLTRNGPVRLGALEVAGLVRWATIPRLVREAVDRG